MLEKLEMISQFHYLKRQGFFGEEVSSFSKYMGELKA